MATPAAVLSILVKANTGQATTGLLRINQQLDITEQKSHKAARAIEGVAKGFALVGGAAVVGGLAYAVKKAADFEQQLSSLGAVADATGKQMEQLRRQALKAGADTKFSALEAAKAQTELAKGGLKTAQILKGGLNAALALAAAGELELADAAATTVNAMKLFGLRGKNAIKVADALATAANTTTADVSDFALALQQSGSAAKTSGLSFKETIVALETLAEVGVKGSDAGTSLKTALIQLASPSSRKAKETAKELGIEVFNAEGKMKSLVDVSKELQDGLSGLTQKQRIQAATTLVGQDGFRALLALYDAGPKKIAKMEKQLGKQGTAAETAKKKQDNLRGSLEQLGGSIETLGIQVGTALLPTIRDAAEQLTDLANDIGKIIDRKDLTLGEKLQKSIDLAQVRVDPWVDKLLVAIDQANIPEKLAAFISGATPVLVKAFAAGGLAAAKTFAGAFVSSDVWGKLVLGGWLLSRMGGKAGFFKMGATAGTAFGAGMASTGGAAGAGGLVGKLKGSLGALKGIAGRLLAIDVAVNLVDSKGNLIAAAINTAHDLTFGIVPKVHVQSGNERAAASIAAVSKQLDAALKTKNVDSLVNVTDKIRAMAKEARDFGRADLAKQLDALATKGAGSIDKLVSSAKNVRGMAARFADAIRGLRLKGSKDFEGLVHQVSFGSRQILKEGGENSKKTQQAISRQFDIARRRVQQAMDKKVVSVKRGTEILHDLAVKELGLYGISAGRVNVVLAKGANGQMRPHQRGGHINEGAPSGDSVPALLERGEYVINRRAVSKVGRKALDRLNFGAAPRFQSGGMIDPAWDPGSERLNQSISGRVGAWAKRFQANMTAGYDPGGGHVSPGHNITGTATDMVPLGGNWDLLEKGLRTLVAAGIKVLYGSNGVGTPWPNHGRGNHAHIEWGSGGNIPGLPSFGGLPRVALQGPASVALEAAQGVLDRVRGAANQSINNAVMFSTEGGESGSNFKGAGGFGKAALKKLWTRAGGDPKVANLMAAIALAESGGNPSARNPSGASGLWQILGQPFAGNVFDPLTNARMAVSKYGSQGLGAWEAYTNGNYSQYLQRGGLVGMAKGGPVGIFNTLKATGAGHTKKGRKLAVDKMLDRVKKAGLSQGLQKDLGMFSKQANTYDEYAGRAETLGAPVNGRSQAEWLTAELEALFKWRNALIRAQEQVVKRRAQITNALGIAIMARGSLKNRIAVLGKHPKANRKALRPLKAQYNAVGKLIPALTDKRSGLNSLRGDLLSSLDDVQGLGSPSGVLRSLPKVGVLGGRIFDVQSTLRSLNAPDSSITDTSSDTSESSSILSQLLREANLRTAVSERQFDVFKNMPQFGGGGIVPGSPGAPVPAVVHAGEGVFTQDQMAAMGGGTGTVHLHFAPGTEWLRDFVRVTVDQETRRQSRNANRRLPGRGGGITR